MRVCPLQVKLRGFRIELGEVEAALADMEGVALAAAAVLQDPSGTPRLVAYYAPAMASEPLLVAGLRGRLPAHMVPTQLVGLARMPLLPNEKIDRRALPAPEWGSPADEEYVAPANELEAQIQAIWQDMLGQERVSTHAGFFAAGGNSLQVGCPLWHRALERASSGTELWVLRLLLQAVNSTCNTFRMVVRCSVALLKRGAGAQAAKVMIRVRQATASSVPTAQLFATPSIAGLAEAIARLALADGSGAAQDAIPRASYSAEERAAGVPCSANQEQMLVLHQLAPESAMYNMMEHVALDSPADARALQVGAFVIP